MKKTLLMIALVFGTLFNLERSVSQASTTLIAPPLGWNSWNAFGCKINEKKIQAQINAMSSNGMQQAGYKYIVIDDCWSAPFRDANGDLQADPLKFPSGIKSLADQAHAHGLKLGIYSDRGTKTCGGFLGSEDHEIKDALQFARWGVDYLKYDNCNANLDEKTQYATMQAALAKANPKMVFSICSWWFRPWIPELGDLWRTTWDIKDVWESNAIASSIDNQSVTSIANVNNLTASYARSGHYNDPDMLMVGNRGQGALGGAGMTDIEYRSHFNLWAIMTAPLISGNDLANMDAVTRETLTNTEIIAVNQDPSDSPEHTQGVRVKHGANLEIWQKFLSNGDVALLLLNRQNQVSDLRVDWADVGLKDNVSVRDVWQHQDLGKYAQSYTAKAVLAHGSVMLRVQGQKLEVGKLSTVSIEAEAATNTITDPVLIKDCAGCSGKAKVGNIRGDGFLRFNNVYSSRTTSVPVTVYFTNARDQLDLKINVNQDPGIFTRVHSSLDPEKLASLRFNLELVRGMNTITFSLPGARAPDIDRISYETALN